jgi:hypothetical protein
VCSSDLQGVKGLEGTTLLRSADEEESDDEDDEESEDEDDEEEAPAPPADKKKSKKVEAPAADKKKSKKVEAPAPPADKKSDKKPSKKAEGEGKPAVVKVGVIDAIVEIIKKASKKAPIDKAGILDALAAKFPSRPRESMKGTINVQVPWGLKKKGHDVQKAADNKGYYIAKAPKAEAAEEAEAPDPAADKKKSDKKKGSKKEQRTSDALKPEGNLSPSGFFYESNDMIPREPSGQAFRLYLEEHTRRWNQRVARKARRKDWTARDLRNQRKERRARK